MLIVTSKSNKENQEATMKKLPHFVPFKTILLGLALALFIGTLTGQPTQAGGPVTRQIPAGGTTSIRPSAQGVDGLQQPELGPGAIEADGGGSINRPRPGFKNGKFPKNPLDAPTVASSTIAGTNPELALSIDGLNHRQQRLANSGNQFSLEPPDQGLCVGNSYVVEAKRQALNNFIRGAKIFDGIVDFDAMTVDTKTGELKAPYLPNSSLGGPGDKLHPNRAGYAAMGNGIDLRWFALR